MFSSHYLRADPFFRVLRIGKMVDDACSKGGGLVIIVGKGYSCSSLNAFLIDSSVYFAGGGQKTADNYSQIV